MGTPTLALARATTTIFTATVSGLTPPKTWTLYYRHTAEAAWHTTTGVDNSQVTVGGCEEGATYLAVAQVTDEVLALSELASVRLAVDAAAPTGPLALPVYHLQSLVAAAAAFQTWVSAADASAARERVYRTEVPADDVEYPCALVWQGPAWNAGLVGGGTHNALGFGGNLGLRFWGAVDPALTGEENEQALTSAVGLIIEDMEALAASGGYLHVTRIAKVDGPWVEPADEGEDQGEGETPRLLQGIEFSVDWGVRA